MTMAKQNRTWQRLPWLADHARLAACPDKTLVLIRNRNAVEVAELDALSTAKRGSPVVNLQGTFGNKQVLGPDDRYFILIRTGRADR